MVISRSLARTREIESAKEMVAIKPAMCQKTGSAALISRVMHASVFAKSRHTKLLTPRFESEWYATGP